VVDALEEEGFRRIAGDDGLAALAAFQGQGAVVEAQFSERMGWICVLKSTFPANASAGIRVARIVRVERISGTYGGTVGFSVPDSPIFGKIRA
jgi:hypothetical protein